MMRAFGLILLVLFCSCKTEIKKDYSSKPNLLRFQGKVDSLFNLAIEKDGPGAAILISYNDSILVSKGYGIRDLSTNAPITSSTNMRVGSISKQFTALGILSLVENGQLSLNDSISQFYPYESLKGVTIRQMLSHQSGIVDADNEYWKNWTLERFVTNDDIIDWYRNHDRKEFDPGQKFEYNNANYEILASLIEKISGQEFPDYIKNHVFDKANMKTSLFVSLAKPVNIPERAYCYEKDSTGTWKIVGNHYLNGLYGASSLYTNLEDFHSYTIALRERKILSTPIDSLLFQPLVKVKELAELDFFKIKETGSYYGLGWELNETMAVHGGETFGAHAFVIFDFNRPITIAIFMNSNKLFETEPNLIDETYKITDKYIKKTTNNVYEP
ncbi:MAG: serine hydrolase domain-containing protein [Maribacter sp.]